jgi:hypothetical protein
MPNLPCPFLLTLSHLIAAKQLEGMKAGITEPEPALLGGELTSNIRIKWIRSIK